MNGVRGAPTVAAPLSTPRAFACRCGRPVFFRNSMCLACHAPLGYDPSIQRLLALEPVLFEADLRADAPMQLPRWREAGTSDATPTYLRCANLETPAACNWLLADDGNAGGFQNLCRCCRLTRTLPDLSIPGNGLYWQRIELAKRRIVSSLIGLKLPVHSRVSEDPVRGLVFDLLRAGPGTPPVVTGHADGVITIDVEEADDAYRELRRSTLGEPYRTLVGHMRHETGHYYWQRLVEADGWLEAWRSLFGDERLDYGTALAAHYSYGAPVDWGQRFVSAYASSHPWEDWAETWAHYLHLVDTLDTARSFAVDGSNVELSYERFDVDVLSEGGADAHTQQAHDFLDLINSWMELTGVLNELSRSMGVADFYPFVLSRPAVRKLYLVHRVIAAAATAAPAFP